MLINDPRKVHETLVDHAMEALVRCIDLPSNQWRAQVAERMAQIAQTIVAEVEVLHAKHFEAESVAAAMAAEAARLRSEVAALRSQEVVIGKLYRGRDGEVVRVTGPQLPPDPGFHGFWPVVVVTKATAHDYEDGDVGTVTERDIRLSWVLAPDHSLPMTCGECPRFGKAEASEHHGPCYHESAAIPTSDGLLPAATMGDAEPPSWCPLREGKP